jgi:uncharacterized membrane protein YphA (DoxX/SURF4 family)
MDTAIWIAQALLAAIFITTGTVKLTQSRAKMAAGPMRWAADVTDAQFRTIGALEILGVLGLAVSTLATCSPSCRKTPSIRTFDRIRTAS